MTTEGGRDQNDMATSQGLLETPEAEEDKEAFSSRAFGGNGPPDTLVSGFWSPECERIHFCCSKTLCLCHLLHPLQETNTISDV